VLYERGDAVTVPGNKLHELLDYSEDLELLELTSPVVYETVRKDGPEMPALGQKVRVEERAARVKCVRRAPHNECKGGTPKQAATS